MKSHHQPLLWLGLVFTILLGTLILVLATHPADRSTVRLPSGESLTVCGVTYGTNHLDPRWPLWMRLLPRSVEPWVRKHAPSLPWFRDITTGEPTLLLWLAKRPAITNTLRTNYFPPQVSGQPPQLAVLMLADETGQAGGRLVDLSSSSANFQTFPRRATKLTLLWFHDERQGLHLFAKSTVPNPARFTAPSWPADALPVTRRDGDLECTLERVGFVTLVRTKTVDWIGGTQLVDTIPGEPGDPFVNAAALLGFHQRGVPTDTWTIESVDMRDATGNDLKSDSVRSGAKAGPSWFYWSPQLWPNETWEVRFCAKRTADAVFTKDELARFTDLPIGLPGISIPWLRHANLPEFNITLEEFTAHRTIDYGYGVVQTNLSELRMTTSESDFDLLKVVDDRGRRYQPHAISMVGQPGTYKYTYTFKDVSLEATNLNIDIAFQHPRYFTFRVKPQLVTTNTHAP